MKLSKTEESLILRGISLAALFCLVVCGGVILFNRSAAWFSGNRSVGASGVSVSLAEIGVTDAYYARRSDAEPYSEITDWDHIFDGLRPGEAVSIRVVYENISDTSHDLRLFFGVTDRAETPLVTEGKYYYLSTQLKITDIVYNDSPIAQETFLLTPPDNRLYYTSEQTVEDTHLVDLSLSAGETAVVEFAILFVNYNDLDQSAYQGFGKGSETCYRRPIAYVD